VKEFTFPNSILFSHCDLAPICTQQKVQAIIQRLQTSSGAVSNDFLAYMMPEIRLNSVRVDLTEGKCGSMNITIIVIPPPPTQPIPDCGAFEYRIPEGLFTDVVKRTTRDFFVTFRTANNEAIPFNSWVRANEPAQTIYGINVITTISQSMTYSIRVRHPISGNEASSSITFTSESYNTLKPIAQNLCLVTIEVVSRYNPGYDDVNILHKFATTLASYLQIRANDIQMYSYLRWGGYPYRLSVTWTLCSLTTTFISGPYSPSYYTSFASIMQNLMVSSGGSVTSSVINHNLVTYFSQNSLFTITTVKTSNCTRPPDTPPTSSGPLTINMYCGFTRCLVPEDLFTDEQDGNTRQLTLQLVALNGSSLGKDAWIYIDDEQYISGMISNTTIVQASNSQYKFLIKATDKDGKSSTEELTIKVPSKPLQRPSVKISMLVNPMVIFDRDIVLMKLITTSIETVVNKTNTGTNLFVSGIASVGTMYQLEVQNCGVCRSSANIRLLNIVNYQSDIQAEMTNELMILSLLSESLIPRNDDTCLSVQGKGEVSCTQVFVTSIRADEYLRRSSW